VTRTPLSRSKGQRSKSPDRFTQRGLNAQGGCNGQRANVFGVGKYCYVASARRRTRRLGVHGERRGGGGILCRHAHSLLLLLLLLNGTSIGAEIRTGSLAFCLSRSFEVIDCVTDRWGIYDLGLLLVISRNNRLLWYRFQATLILSNNANLSYSLYFTPLWGC